MNPSFRAVTPVSGRTRTRADSNLRAGDSVCLATNAEAHGLNRERQTIVQRRLQQFLDRYVDAEQRLRETTAAVNQIPAARILWLLERPGSEMFSYVFMAGHASPSVRNQLASWILRRAVEPSPPWQKILHAMVGGMNQDCVEAALPGLIDHFLAVGPGEVDFTDALVLAWTLKSRQGVERLITELRTCAADREAQVVADDFEAEHQLGLLPQGSSDPRGKNVTIVFVPEPPDQQEMALWGVAQEAYERWHPAAKMIRSVDPMSAFLELRSQRLRQVEATFLAMAFEGIKRPRLHEAFLAISPEEVEEYARDLFQVAQRDAGATARLLKELPGALRAVKRDDLADEVIASGIAICGTFDAFGWLTDARHH